MEWRTCDPVQTVGALFLRDPAGEGALPGLAGRLMETSALFGKVQVERGADWIMLLAARLPVEEDAKPGLPDLILPDLPGAQMLYAAHPRCWLPVGVAPSVPARVTELFIGDLLAGRAFNEAAIILPKFQPGETVTRAADVFLMGKLRALESFRVASPAELPA